MKDLPTAPSQPDGAPPRRASATTDARAWALSAAIHLALAGIVVAVGLMAPKPSPPVAVFELVSVERPKLRPIAPKTPEPPAEKPPRSRPPEAPKLAPKPQAAPKPQPRPEAKTTPLPAPDTTLPVREAPQPSANLTTTIVANLPSDPRLGFWARTVKKRVEQYWNPPTGIDVPARAKTVVAFEVARDGTVGAVGIVAPSGNTLLDDLARRTIMRLERVPPIPENFPGESLKVSYEFIYNAN